MPLVQRVVRYARSARSRPRARREGFAAKGFVAQSRNSVTKFPRRGWQAIDGAPYPLGVSYVVDEDAYNFALYSKHAARVTLVLYGADDWETPLATFQFDVIRNRTGRIWHCRLPSHGLERARYYAYQIGGEPDQCTPHWQSFAPEKILLDPYAREIYFPPSFDRKRACEPGANAGHAALGLLHARPRAAAGPRQHPHHDADLVIYELHVRGFTRHPSSPVAEANRGTFAGVVEMIPYLTDLGVTAVELMPVFQFDPQSGDYWGYSPISFFAPHALTIRGGRTSTTAVRATPCTAPIATCGG
jgi:isoamylase